MRMLRNCTVVCVLALLLVAPATRRARPGYRHLPRVQRMAHPVQLGRRRPGRHCAHRGPLLRIRRTWSRDTATGFPPSPMRNGCSSATHNMYIAAEKQTYWLRARLFTRSNSSRSPRPSTRPSRVTFSGAWRGNCSLRGFRTGGATPTCATEVPVGATSNSGRSGTSRPRRVRWDCPLRDGLSLDAGAGRRLREPCGRDCCDGSRARTQVYRPVGATTDALAHRRVSRGCSAGGTRAAPRPAATCQSGRRPRLRSVQSELHDPDAPSRKPSCSRPPRKPARPQGSPGRRSIRAGVAGRILTPRLGARGHPRPEPSRSRQNPRPGFPSRLNVAADDGIVVATGGRVRPGVRPATAVAPANRAFPFAGPATHVAPRIAQCFA